MSQRAAWGLAIVLLLGCDGAGDTDSGVEAGMQDASDGFFNCDPRTVTCADPAPMCMFGFSAVVADGCWGACLQSAGCRPMACEEATTTEDCPAGWGCVLAMCRPPR